MIRTLLLSTLTAGLVAASAPAAAVSFDWAYVGNAGNAGELTGNGFCCSGPEVLVGAVAYNYAISKTEVTNAQYAAFLNAVDPTGGNSLALYNPEMAANFGGIELQAAKALGDKFVVKSGREQNPVTYVSFFDAMRFANWLHNGQGAGETEEGAYTIGNGVSEVRSTNAKYWIPSEDEWYKAAYHDATAGTAGVYFDYANGSNTMPVSDQPGDNPAAANYRNNDFIANGFNDGYAVSGSSDDPDSTNPFTDVGAYTATVSPYGTFDQNGNAYEWNEAVGQFSTRGIRGSSWDNGFGNMQAYDRGFENHASEIRDLGFRVATVPEPSAVVLGVVAAAGVLIRRRG